jgi:hypothetical protein
MMFCPVDLLIVGNQFKVNFDQLRSEIKKNAWVCKNLLIAVASGTSDGTAGLQKDASLTTLRKEIERYAHVIFDSNPKARKFWLGQGVMSPEQLLESYGGSKPCLHGCDAHAASAITGADSQRLCWIKGDLTFESLRQVCIEPEVRVAIGPTPPLGAMPSQVIDHIHLTNASWLRTPEVPLNGGLVAIIGARGSGKTALADFIAAGASAFTENSSERSFIKRARKYLTNSEVEMYWQDGGQTSQGLAKVAEGGQDLSPRVRYLSQQFVDNLCLAEGLTDELLQEIERVIYQAHASEMKTGTSSFRQLLDMRAEYEYMKRHNLKEALLEVGSPFESEPASSRVEAPVNAALQDLKVVSIIRHGVVRRKLQGRVDLLVF